MTTNENFDVACERFHKRLRQKTSQEIIAAVKKRGPAPGSGGAPHKENPKNCKVSIRFSQADQDLIGAATSKTGETVAEFVREAAIKKALRKTR